MANRGLPKKYAKHGFKRGWQLYKRKRKTAGTTTRRAMGAPKRKTTKKRTTTSRPSTNVIVVRGANTMAEKNKTTTRRRRMGRGLITVTDVRTGVDALVTAGGTIASLIAVNKIPWVRDQASWVKALIQGGAGLATMRTLRRREAKQFAKGMLVGSGVSVALPFVPEGLRVFGRRALAPAEINQLKTVGKPYTPTSVGRPMHVPTNNTAPMMGRAGNRKSQYS